MLGECLERLPGDARTQLALITYDAHAVHFYALQRVNGGVRAKTQSNSSNGAVNGTTNNTDTATNEVQDAAEKATGDGGRMGVGDGGRLGGGVSDGGRMGAGVSDGGRMGTGVSDGGRMVDGVPDGVPSATSVSSAPSATRTPSGTSAPSVASNPSATGTGDSVSKQSLPTHTPCLFRMLIVHDIDGIHSSPLYKHISFLFFFVLK